MDTSRRNEADGCVHRKSCLIRCRVGIAQAGETIGLLRFVLARPPPSSPAKALGRRAREEPTGVTLEAIGTAFNSLPRDVSMNLSSEILGSAGFARVANRAQAALLRRTDEVRTVVAVDTHILALFRSR
jgi:hypothetical protein